MIRNPVFTREMKVSSRSIKTPLILAVFNFILAAFALTNMAAAINIARDNAQMDYSVFIGIFIYVAIIEFVLILFVMPALTAGSISGERERRTLDIMLTTRLTPVKIVTGKLLSGLSNVLIILVSSLPILSLVFVYGGVTLSSLALILVSFVTAAIITASIGVWASSFCRRSSFATAISYAAVVILVGGTAGLCHLTFNLTGSAGYTHYLMLANPASTFYAVISDTMGEKNAMEQLAARYNTVITLSAQAWFAVGTAVQLIISIILVLFSVRNVGPSRKV